MTTFVKEEGKKEQENLAEGQAGKKEGRESNNAPFVSFESVLLYFDWSIKGG